MDMTTRFNGFEGIQLAADVTGDPDSPAIVLLPGFGQTRAAWSRAAKALAAAGRYVITLDLRGHGESGWSPTRHYALGDMVQDVIAVVAQLPTRPAIVGAGLGGLAALAAIGEQAEPIASALVLVDAAPRMARKGLDRMTRLMTVGMTGFDSVEQAAAAIALHLPQGTPPKLDEMPRHLRRADDGRYRWHIDPAYHAFTEDASVRLPALQRLTAAAAAVRIPTLLVRGQDSALLDEDSVSAFRDLVPHAECADLAGVGGAIVGDRNDAFDATILEFLERVVPRADARPQGGIEPRLLRDALGCFATGVTVITSTTPEGEPIGFTVNSFTSVSLDPPLVLFCVKRNSASIGALRERGAFAVNILHMGQQAISSTFASRAVDRFSGIGVEHWDCQVPIIREAMANFECTVDEVHEGGDHLIVVGRVNRVHFDAARDPLLFLQGKYRRVHVAREEIEA
jgi:flavin reductase (DIM6/NTAB) family NADH-FMN oxidoreductase RutF/pimeloyl-ACP methyl ester carboxylesterase